MTSPEFMYMKKKVHFHKIGIATKRLQYEPYGCCIENKIEIKTRKMEVSASNPFKMQVL